MYEQSCKNSERTNAYEDFHHLLTLLVEEEVYSNYLLTMYSEQEIRRLEEAIVPERDHLFTYIGLKTLSDRYIARSKSKKIYELPSRTFHDHCYDFNGSR